MKNYFLSIMAVYAGVASQSAFASGAKACDLEVKIDTISTGYRLFGNKVSYRIVEGRVVAVAAAKERNDIDCEKTFPKADKIKFSLVLPEKGSLEELTKKEAGDAVEVRYRYLDGLTPHGIGINEDFWFVK